MTTQPAATRQAPGIRPATLADIPAIADIYAYHVTTGTASFETDAPNNAEMQRRMDAILAGNYPYIVAEADGKIAGYAYAGPYRTRPAYRNTVENSIYVDAAYAGRGIGGYLLPALIEACQSKGFKQMIAVIGDNANVPSVRLHEKCGFKHVGVLRNVGFKFDRWLDTIFMQRDLTA